QQLEGRPHPAPRRRAGRQRPTGHPACRLAGQRSFLRHARRLRSDGADRSVLSRERVRVRLLARPLLRRESGARRDSLTRYASPLAWMARQTRSGVAGISTCSTPTSASASTIALTTAPSAGVVPPSPPPRRPSGLEVDGTS